MVINEAVDGARVANELAASAEIRAMMLRTHAREAAVTAKMTRSAEARRLFESLSEQREQTARLLSQQASYLRVTARLLRELEHAARSPEASRSAPRS